MPLGTKVGLGPGHVLLHRDPSPPHPKRGTATSPNFWLMSIVAEYLFANIHTGIRLNDIKVNTLILMNGVNGVVATICNEV